MKASDLLVRCLENEGVRFVFGVPGEETLDVVDSFLDSRQIRFVTTRHEQSAAFMADVHGRLTGKAGVCLSTLGPGATNLLTGISDANLDRAPLVAITGQVSLDRMHKESHQYIDVLTILRPVTKWNAEILTPRILPEAVRKAFKTAQTEKPGATHLELPEDVAAEKFVEPLAPLQPQAPFIPEPLNSQVKRAIQTISRARRPIVLAGNGVIRSRASDAIRRFSRALRIPVSHTFMAKGIMPDSDPLSLYTIGLHMRDYAATIFEEADVVIAVGYDFVEYAPCFWNANTDKRIVHVDTSPAEVDSHYIVDVGVLGDLTLSLDQMLEGLAPLDGTWARYCQATVRDPLQAELEASGSWPLSPQRIVRELRGALSRPDDLIVCDVGAHKLWMARMFACEVPNTCLISNGFAAMGIALPGAIAARLLYPDRRVVAVVGDGGFLMNAQELETAVRLRLPIVIVVWRDQGYGVIRWKQQLRFGRASAVDFGNPDLVRFAESFGATGFRVARADELGEVLAKALACDGPAVVDCPVDYAENLRLSERLRA
jgi:acetolactate synthase-1/2/3 large subunit